MLSASLNTTLYITEVMLSFNNKLIKRSCALASLSVTDTFDCQDSTMILSESMLLQWRVVFVHKSRCSSDIFPKTWKGEKNNYVCAHINKGVSGKQKNLFFVFHLPFFSRSAQLAIVLVKQSKSSSLVTAGMDKKHVCHSDPLSKKLCVIVCILCVVFAHMRVMGNTDENFMLCSNSKSCLFTYPLHFFALCSVCLVFNTFESWRHFCVLVASLSFALLLLTDEEVECVKSLNCKERLCTKL